VKARRFWCVLASFAVCGGLAVAQDLQPAPVVEQPISWLQSLWNLPVFRWLAGYDAPVAPIEPAFDATPTLDAVAGPVLPPCSVESLPAIIDPVAQGFENRTNGSAVNLDGLTTPTSRALSRFEDLVEKRGGSFMLTSAYRPETYQQHLRDVWYKWMTELKDNRDPSCATLKADVGEEFTRHQLLPTQHPVAVSDHTLGIGFDAAILLPQSAGKKKRFRISLDRLARSAGMMRPNVGGDPVHFRLIGGRRG
jgi:hypothetical protein